jgi:hypothetical protein
VKKYFFAALALAATLTEQAGAQEIDCSAALISDKTEIRSNWSVRSAYFSRMTKQTFEERRQNGSLNVILEGLPLGVSFEDAKKYYEVVDQFSGNTVSNIGSEVILRSSLGENAVRAYSDCLKNTGTKTILLAWVDSSAADFVRVAYRWTPSEIEQSAFKEFSIKTFTEELNPENDLPTSGTVHYINIKRNLKETISLSFDATLQLADTDEPRHVKETLLVPWLPNVKIEKEYAKRKSDPSDLYIFWNRVEAGGPANLPFSLVSEPGYFIDKESVVFHKVTYDGSCGGDFWLVNEAGEQVIQPIDIGLTHIRGLFRATTTREHCGFAAVGQVTWNEWKPIVIEW